MAVNIANPGTLRHRGCGESEDPMVNWPGKYGRSRPA